MRDPNQRKKGLGLGLGLRLRPGLDWRAIAARPIETGPAAIVRHVTKSKEGLAGREILNNQARRDREKRREKLYLNDRELFKLISHDRKHSNHHHAPEDWMTAECSPLFDRAPCPAQTALMTLRGPALKLTRQELADYCGISAMTIYRQESTNWDVEHLMPHWYYWLVLLKWASQCWGHMPHYKQHITVLDTWCALSGLTRKQYLLGKKSGAVRV